MRRLQSWRAIRIAAMALGGILVLLALSSDLLGIGERGFGRAQMSGLALGLCLVALGWLGPRFPELYRGAALVLLNTLVLFVVLELGAALIRGVVVHPAPAATLYLTPAPDEPPRPAYYAAQSWSETYWHEVELARVNRRNTYRAYQLWRFATLQGQTVRVGPDGLRETPGAECVAGAYVVGIFGGSTVWGVGSPDWGTIPAYLQAALDTALQRPVCVRNLGMIGWNTTQDLIALIRELQAGRVPDLVVFYSGVNEIIPAWEYGEAGVPFGITDFAARVEDRLVKSHPLEALSLYQLVRGVFESERPLEPPLYRYQHVVSDSLAESVVRTYLTNRRTVESLGREYGFAVEFFWQPNLLAGIKPLTNEEARFKAAARVAPMVERVYQRIASLGGRDLGALHNLMNLFTGDSSLVYIDWHHMIPEGNQKVAAAMLPLLLADARKPQPAIAHGPGAVGKTTLPKSNPPGSGPPSRQ